MPIITPPTIVQNALDEFLSSLLANDPQRKHLANYLTGLLIAENKTVAGMTNEMPNAFDQSCLNRFLTEVDWDHEAVSCSGRHADRSFAALCRFADFVTLLALMMTRTFFM